MDEIDQAQVYSDDFQAFAMQLNKISREPVNYSGIYCLDCNDEIPLKRRQAAPGCRRCIDCQTEFEKERTA